MKLLIVEDEKKTGEYLTKGLTEAGFVVDLADNGLNGYHLAMTGDYDLIILDIMLPDVNGWDIVRMLRSANKGMPILLLTALGTIEHRVKGLELGADDYLVKPFDLAELSARIGSVARRYAGNPNPIVTLGNLEVDLAARNVRADGRAVPLTAKEWVLFEAFLQRPQQLLSKAQLEQRLYSFDTEIDSNTIEVHVSRLRKKLGHGVIETERGLGYRLGSA